MMKLLAKLELLIASFVEHRMITRERYQPGDLDPLLKRHLYNNTMQLPRGAIAPNRFDVTLDDQAHARFRPLLDVLAQELAVSLTDYCERMGFELKAPIEVHFETAMELETGRVVIDGHIAQETG